MVVTVDAPITPHITGSMSVCTSHTITLTGTPAGGTWSSTPVVVASVSALGVVTGGSPGIATISYQFINSCGTYTATAMVTDNPYAAPITGPTAVCTSGPNIALSDATTGGTWSSATVHTNVSSGGVVAGISAGTETITYSLSTTCGMAYSYYTVEVDAPSVSISGAFPVCSGSVITLTGFSPGGTWTSSNTAVATVDASGDVTGVSLGSANISYSASNSCGGPYTTSVPISVEVPLSPGTITGPNTVCSGSFITLSDSGDPGTWSSSDPSTAYVVASSGIVTGETIPGTATITYTVSNICGSFISTYSITVNPLPNAGNIVGSATTICFLSTLSLSDPTGDAGGTWSSSNTSVAVVNPSSGFVTGVSGGTTTITYLVTNIYGCTSFAIYSLAVDNNPNAGSISGSSPICAGSTPTLSAVGGDAGGTWTSNNSSIATIDPSTGVETGIIEGTSLITYTVTNACGTATATFVTTVEMPAGTIYGSTAVCVSSTITLTDATTGGTWASSDATIASVVSGTGVVTGVAGGTATITFSVTNSCGTTTETFSVIVDVPTVSISAPGGLFTVCPPDNIGYGFSTWLVGTPAEWGTWTSSNLSIDTVTQHNADSAWVTGVSSGTNTITYTVTNSCGTHYATHSFTVYPVPNVGSLTGPSVLNSGTPSATYSESASGYVSYSWFDSDPSYASSSSPTPSSIVLTEVLAGYSTSLDYTIQDSDGCQNNNIIIVLTR